MDTSSSPGMRYIRDRPPMGSQELSSEEKFLLLRYAVASLDAKNLLFDLIGNRTMTSNYDAIDDMVCLGKESVRHEMNDRRLRLICSRSWEKGTDYFFLTLDKHWYWVRADETNSVFKVGRLVSMQELQWQMASEIETQSREADDIFQQLLEALASIVTQEYETRRARADRYGSASRELSAWASRSNRLKYSR